MNNGPVKHYIPIDALYLVFPLPGAQEHLPWPTQMAKGTHTQQRYIDIFNNVIEIFDCVLPLA